MNAPKVIIREASFYLKNVPGSVIVHLGTYLGQEAYYVKFPDAATVGYPPVFLLKGSVVKSVIGEEALRIISSFSAS